MAAAFALPALAGAQAQLEPPFTGETHDCTQEAPSSESVVGGFYEGRFADGSPFQINLPYARPPGSQPGADFVPSGWWRSRAFAGEALPLTVDFDTTATAASGGAFVAIVDDRSPTQRFAGSFSTDRTHASGAWSDARGHSRSFELVRVAEYHALHLTQPQPDEATTKDSIAPPGPYVFDALWPVLPDAQATAQARRMVTACRGSARGIREEWHVATIAWHGTDALSLRIEDGVMPMVAAHPGLSSRTLEFVVEGDSFRVLALGETLASTASCEHAAADGIQRALRRQKAAWPANGGLRPENFLALPQGLVFFFDPAEVEAGAAGTRQAFVPARQLGRCVRWLPASPT